MFYHLLTKFTIFLCSRLTLADLTNHLRLDFQTQPRLQKASISAEAFYRKSFPREILLSTRCQYSSKSPKMLSPPEGSRPNLVSILILVNTLFLWMACWPKPKCTRPKDFMLKFWYVFTYFMACWPKPKCSRPKHFRVTFWYVFAYFMACWLKPKCLLTHTFYDKILVCFVLLINNI